MSCSAGFRVKLLAALACLAGGAAPQAWAQTPPAGAIFDLAVAHPGLLTRYHAFSVSFTAAQADTTVSFAFREVPAFFAFDNASITAAGSTANLLQDAGFETAAVGSDAPAGWQRFMQPADASFVGEVASNAARYGCVVPASQGTRFWCDGSVEGYDGLAQTIATTAGQTYTVRFDLQNDSATAITPPGIDMLVYAGDGLPSGVVPVPEPASLALLATGLLGMGLLGRRCLSRAAPRG